MSQWASLCSEDWPETSVSGRSTVGTARASDSTRLAVGVWPEVGHCPHHGPRGSAICPVGPVDLARRT